jgi:hypothetical protein
LDAIALIATVVGLKLATHGYVLTGSAVLFGPLIALAILFSRTSKPRLLLFTFNFNAWFVVLPISLLIVLLLQVPFTFGLALYYLGCVCLIERKARYVPWGTGFESKTATRNERPVVYWLVVGLFFTLSAVFLGITLVSAPQ